MARRGFRRQLCIALLLCAPACGDDGDAEQSSGTTAVGPATDDATSAASSTSGAADEGSSSDDGGSSGLASSSGEASSSGGDVADPSYPPIDGGMCEGGTAPVMLPDASLCAPFCTGRADTCRDAASGDAPAQCTPFLDMQGSGDPCDAKTPCTAPEECGTEGTCGEVAFWACQLVCGGGEACPDGMHCSSIGTCGY